MTGFINGYHIRPYHFSQVEPNVLYRGGSQKPFVLNYLNKLFSFKTIVSLRDAGEGGWNANWHQQETQFCRRNKLRFYNIPLRGKLLPTDDQITLWLTLLSDRSNYPVYVHCAQGVTRTGIMVALYQIALQGKDPQEVWEQLPRFGHNFEKRSYEALKQFVLTFSADSYFPWHSSVADESDYVKGGVANSLSQSLTY